MNKSKFSVVSIAVFVACSTLTTVLILTIKLTGLNDPYANQGKTKYHFRSDSLRNLSEVDQKDIEAILAEEEAEE